MAREPAPRKHLSADALYRRIYETFQDVQVVASGKSPSLADALMSGFAVFALKEPSLLAFDERRKQDAKNLEMIFHIGHVPCDTHMREMLDPVNPEQLRPAFRRIFLELERGGVLEQMRFLDKCYLLALDGTEYFCSRDVHCPHCLERQRSSGEIEYHHSFLGASLVCPGRPEVVPLMPEPIRKQDGQTKNDCERNALPRWVQKFRQDHPHLKVIVSLDALYANAPVIGDLREAQMSWIIRVKEDGNAFLFQQVRQRAAGGQVEEFAELGSDKVHRRFRLAWDLPLNASHPAVRVDFLEVWEPSLQGNDDEHHFAFAIEPVLGLCRARAERLMWGGRARWKVENETFNTLKNQGYHLEHNYGHGYQHLSVVMLTLMMLAFLVDQTSQLCCTLFGSAWEQCRSKRALWEGVREIFHRFTVASMADIYEALYREHKPRLRMMWDTS
ncbi:MAG: hypothetical protein MUE50_15885 [Pirellulaceae bacterium]|jgi:hypothetical protein|nr:hypothetical protein [Pirellulaceae bacterium]